MNEVERSGHDSVQDPTEDLSVAEWEALKSRVPSERGVVTVVDKGNISRKIEVDFSSGEIAVFLAGMAAVDRISPELTREARESVSSALAGLLQFPSSVSLANRELALGGMRTAASTARRVLPLVKDLHATQGLVEPLTRIASAPRQVFNAVQQGPR